MLKARIRANLAVVTVTGAFTLLALASLAVAFATTPDFAPFSIRKEVWLATMSSAGAGTEISDIDYTSANDWRVTIISNSGSQGYAGTSWTFKGTTTFFSDALHRVSRSYDGANQPDRWIAPGLVDSMTATPGWQVVPSSTGVLHLRRLESSTQNGIATSNTTDATFDATTGLPNEIEIRGSSGDLLQRWTYSRR